MSLSVLTIVRNRTAHLANLIEGVRRSSLQPDEVIIVDMSDEPVAETLDAPGVRFERLETDGLPLAQARNRAAACATGDHLVFLDVDCIPMRACLAHLTAALGERDGLICAEALYLGPNDASGAWEESDLLAKGHRHPARRFPDEGLKEVGNPGLFWSLAFAIRRATFSRIGGFDERFTGYGAEDTDFGFTAQAAGCPLYFCGGAFACHQHHETFDPPLQHLDDIVANAIRYHRKWGWWPMHGWLQTFVQMGVVDWRADRVRILRRPTPEELKKSRCT
ncbi:MAG: glycosyltransferase [Parvularcula sp.]|jgi:GT2 family glycosyltransferase|nr:glycosyltransferase [Parvularcula sp.]